jgi:hypothetical protein
LPEVRGLLAGPGVQEDFVVRDSLDDDQARFTAGEDFGGRK